MKNKIIHEFSGEINGVEFKQKETYNITSAVLSGLEINFNIQIEDEDFTKEIRNEIGKAFNWCGPSEFEDYLSDFIYNIGQIENLNEDKLFPNTDYFTDLNDILKEYLLENTKNENGILL
jgi:hypothetical protein